MRVGEKETSEQAAIVARYADLFTRDQLAVLREAEAGADGAEGESIARLRLTCQEGIVTAELAEREDALENALLAARVAWDGEELPLRSAQARLAVEPDLCPARRARRRRAGRVGRLQRRAPRPARRSPRARDRGDGDLRAGRAQRGGEGRSAPPDPARRRPCRGSRARRRSRRSGSAGSTACWARSATETPASAHMAWIRRLSPLESTYTKERSVPVCLDDAARARVRPGRREGDPTRPRGPPAEVPARLRDRVRPAAGRPPDHPRAGRAARLRGVPPRGGPRAPLRGLRRRRCRSRSAASRATTPSPRSTRSCSTRSRRSRAGTPSTSASRTRRRSRNADAARFSNTLLFRRYSAKLGYEIDFWTRFPTDGGTPDGYEERLTAATGIRYPAANHLADMDSGFYSADYLRAWIRSAQVRALPAPRGGAGLVAATGDRSAPARPLPRGHAADDGGDRGQDRLRPARHRTARRRADRALTRSLSVVARAGRDGRGWLNRHKRCLSSMSREGVAQLRCRRRAARR